MKVAAAFMAVYSGLCGYIVANPNNVVYAVGGQVLYKGRVAVLPPPGHVSELDTAHPLYPLRTRLAAEMVQAMDLATASAKGIKWLSTYCTTDMISNALTLMVATKFNWYQTNHHVGQGNATHFKHKIASTMCLWMQSTENNITEVAKSMIWEIGHWVSTHLWLNLMGMRTGIGSVTFCLVQVRLVHFCLVQLRLDNILPR